MANPNRTVWHARNAKTVCTAEHVFNNESDARDKAEEMKRSGQFCRVVVRSFRVGPRNKNYKNWTARGYENA